MAKQLLAAKKRPAPLTVREHRVRRNRISSIAHCAACEAEHRSPQWHATNQGDNICHKIYLRRWKAQRVAVAKVTHGTIRSRSTTLLHGIKSSDSSAFVELVRHRWTLDSDGHTYYAMHVRQNIIAMKIAFGKLKDVHGFGDLVDCVTVLGHAVPLFWSWPILAFVAKVSAALTPALALQNMRATHNALKKDFKGVKVHKGQLCIAGKHGNCPIGWPHDYGCSAKNIAALMRVDSNWSDVAAAFVVILKMQKVSVSELMATLRAKNAKPYSGRRGSYFSISFVNLMVEVFAEGGFADTADDWSILLTSGKQKTKATRLYVVIQCFSFCLQFVLSGTGVGAFGSYMGLA